jgi:H+/Cl- antiporter ClcA
MFRRREMNPLTWQREHQVALLLGIVLGIVLGLLVGFMYEGFHYASVENWKIESRFRWGILGALVGACVILMQRLLRI